MSIDRPRTLIVARCTAITHHLHAPLTRGSPTSARYSNREGLRVALADVNAERLKDAGAECVKLVGEQNVLVVPTDVSKLEDVERLRDKVLEQWGEVSMRAPACQRRESSVPWLWLRFPSTQTS